MSRLWVITAFCLGFGVGGCGKGSSKGEDPSKKDKAAAEAVAVQQGEANFAAITTMAKKVNAAMASAPTKSDPKCPALPGAGKIPVIGTQMLAVLADGGARDPNTDTFAKASWPLHSAWVYGGLEAKDAAARKIYATKLAEPDAAVAGAAKVVGVIRLDKIKPPQAGELTGISTDPGGAGKQATETEKYSFKPGRADGWVLLVDVDAGRVVCGEEIKGENPSSMETTAKNLQDALTRDLADYVNSSVDGRIRAIAPGREPMTTREPSH